MYLQRDARVVFAHDRNGPSTIATVPKRSASKVVISIDVEGIGNARKSGTADDIVRIGSLAIPHERS